MTGLGFKSSVVLSIICLLLLNHCSAGQWYPGIIHCHSTFSDGGNRPAELANIVQSELKKHRNDRKGFIIVTDHYDGTRGKGPEIYSAYLAAIRNTSIPGQFVAIPGLELGSKWRPEANTVATSHILAIGLLPDDYTKLDACYDRNADGTLVEKFDFQQKIINQILALGLLPVAAHPSQLVIGGRSILRTDHRFNMHSGYSGLRGVEMFNVLGPGQEEESFRFYLRLLSEGFPIFVTSGSDYHGTPASIIPELALGALERITWVYADNLTEDAILRAIAEGKTYAAQGGAQFFNFLRDYGQNPGIQVTGVDQPLIRALAFLPADQVEMIVYRNEVEVYRQKQKGDASRTLSYFLTGSSDSNQRGWLDPDNSSSGVRSYVIRVMATKNGNRQTVLVTSPIRLRLRPPGQTAAFFDMIKSGAVARVAEFLRNDPSLANERDRRQIPEEEAIRYHSDRPLALSVAATLGNVEILRILLNAGASPDNYLGVGEPGPLMNVACTGNIQVANLLLQYGADVNINTDGNTPLVWAIGSRHSDLARWLIEHGADINHPGDSGRRPLTIAKQVGLPEIVKILSTKGARE